MAQKKYLIIYNPIAGKGRAAERLPATKALLSGSGLDYEIRVTTGVWHAARLALEAGREGFYAAVAAGGDGTVNEVLNGLMLSGARGDKIPAMGVLAAGRGNDFCYGVDIPEQLEACIEALVRDEQRPLDVGFIQGGDYPDGRYFGNGIGAGFDTIVGLEASRMKHVQGSMAYVLGALKSFIKFPAAPVIQVKTPEATVSRKSHQVSIMNGKRLGGTFFYAPWAESHDGLFDLGIANELSRRTMVKLILDIAKSSHGKNPNMQFSRSSRFEITAPQGGLVVHADGETICTNGSSLVVECLPGKIALICVPGLHPAIAKP